MRRVATITGAAFVALVLAPLVLSGAGHAQSGTGLTITPAAPPKPRPGHITLPSAQDETSRPIRILVFGDSLTEGYGLPPDQGLVAQLQRWLEARGADAQAINAGLTGDTSYGGRIRIKWALRHRPDAVVVELGANDFLMGWALPDIEKNLDVIIRQAKAGGRPVLLVGITPPKAMQGVDPDDIAAMWHRLAARHETLLLPDLYAPVWAASGAKTGAGDAEHLQKDGLHLSAKGVEQAIAQGLGPQVLALIAKARAQNEKDRAGP